MISTPTAPGHAPTHRKIAELEPEWLQWMSAFPDWDSTEVLFEGVGVDPGLLTAAQEANSPTFAIPGL